MERPSHSQLELFSQSKDYPPAVKRSLNKVFFGYIRGYEKVLLAIIGFMITGIVSFSLGVEKGKKLTISSIPDVPVKPTMTEKIEKQDTRPSIQEQGLYNYTIQVASYQSRTSAEKEAQTLRKKGHPPLILPKGKYSVVCVGNFADKKMATAMLSELKKRYRDCFIRRL